MHRYLKAVGVILLAACLTGCSSKISEEVALFNSDTERAISEYKAVTSEVGGRTEELIQGIDAGDLSAFPVSDDFDVKEAQALIHEHASDAVAPDVNVIVDDFYTRIGYYSVTQVTQFYYKGTKYLMEALWVDGKLDSLNMEVLSDVL